MQFIPLDNFKAILRRAANNSMSPKFTDMTGTEHSLTLNSSSYPYNVMPLFNAVNSTPRSGGNTANYLYCYASTDDNIPLDRYAPNEIVGTATTVTSARNSNGWSMEMTITGSENKTIKSIYFSRLLHPGSSGKESVIFAVKLDTPVELNAENNYTAHFTFAIEF